MESEGIRHLAASSTFTLVSLPLGMSCLSGRIDTHTGACRILEALLCLISKSACIRHLVVRLNTTLLFSVIVRAVTHTSSAHPAQVSSFPRIEDITHCIREYAIFMHF